MDDLHDEHGTFEIIEPMQNLHIGDAPVSVEAGHRASEDEAATQTDISFELNSWPCLVVERADHAVCNGLAILAHQRLTEH